MKDLYLFLESLDKEQKTRLQTLEDLLKGLKYEDYIEKLDEMVADPKTAALVEDAFGGELAQTKLRMSTCKIPASKLIPTQNEIDLDKSLKWGLKMDASCDMYFAKPAVIKTPIVTYNKQFVIDGHHRWSQIYCFNPSAQCLCVNFEGNLSPIEMLKAVQGSIAADIHNVPVEKVEGKSIFDENEDSIRKYIEDGLEEPVVEKICNLTNCKDRAEVVDYLVSNVMKLKTDNEPIKAAPKRDFMPQANKASNALDRLKNTTKIK